jgi:lipopolysaccharide biosynthesis regulator YciM
MGMRYTQHKENFMPQAQPMTEDDISAIIEKAHSYMTVGNMDECERLMRQLPLAPYLAEFAKKRLGPDFLIEGGFNLSEADAEFGENWLN